ncbi:hypothetical protein C7S20_02960 [Christiangramia fulva]|uniref:Uncharacterized protein n=1 Tax=Christiangramia fulva TaxID=2126553 RepID=A0A2R3Z232_9FLAO|nr:hypothetical protein [Christiangramia fulva]AVR44299.1 hypothetical protein C7S20_02960 [Christiangramia fulva]
MKNFKTFWLLSFLIPLLISCSKEEAIDQSIEGSYVGYLSAIDAQAISPVEAQADVQIVEDHLVEIHCYSESLDTIVRLNYYANNEDYMLCLSGDDFEHEYGHAMSHENMPSNMMGETEWRYHLENEHSEGDEHFGKFGMADHSFECLFEINHQDQSYELHFQGVKQ